MSSGNSNTKMSLFQIFVIHANDIHLMNMVNISRFDILGTYIRDIKLNNFKLIKGSNHIYSHFYCCLLQYSLVV